MHSILSRPLESLESKFFGGIRWITDKFFACIRRARPKWRADSGVLPLWSQVHYFSLAWNVIAGLLLIVVCLDMPWPRFTSNQPLCDLESSVLDLSERRTFVTLIDYPVEAASEFSKSERGDQFRFVTTNGLLKREFCKQRSLGAKLLNIEHDSFTREQHWEQVIYEHVISDRVLYPIDAINGQLDVVLMVADIGSCFDKLPLSIVLNKDLIFILTESPISEAQLEKAIIMAPALTKSMDGFRLDYQAIASGRVELTEPTAELLEWLERQNRILNHFGASPEPRSRCRPAESVLRMAVSPILDFDDMVPPSTEVVLFLPITAACLVALSSRFGLLLKWIWNALLDLIFPDAWRQ